MKNYNLNFILIYILLIKINSNENIFKNPVLRRNIAKILDRTEFRITDCDNKYKYEIVPHSTPVPFACTVVESVQGGPMILPELRLEEEFFVLKDENGKIISESASALHRYARTAIGIRDNNLYIFIATDKAPKTLEEMAGIARKYKMGKALALDGGGSTSIDFEDIHIITKTSDTVETGRKVKSFLIVP